MSYREEIISDVRKNKWIFVLLLLIILAGLFLRSYHASYPVVGYHNWKETHYLTEARNFAEDGFFEYGFFVPSYDYPGLDTAQSGAHADTFPFISIVVGIFFKIFGSSITVARIINILFSISAIPVMFLIVRRLFKRTNLAIVSALVTALCPLFVFFSHNTQLQNPGVLFMLLSAYFYVRWHENDSNKDLIFTSLFLALSALNVFTFLVIAIPMAFTFPIERIKKFTHSRLKAYLISTGLLSTVLLWVLYMKFAIAPLTGRTTFSAGLVNLAPFYQGGLWAPLKAFTADNYSLFGFVFAFIGLFVILSSYLKKRGLFGKKFALPVIIASVIIVPIIAKITGFGFLYFLLFAVFAFFALPIFRQEFSEEAQEDTFGEKFMLFYGIATFLFFFVIIEKLIGHSYHQFPVAPFFIISMSFAFVAIGSNIGNLLSAKAEKTSSEEKIGKSDVFKIIKYLTVIFLVVLLVYGFPAKQVSPAVFGDDLALSGTSSAINRQFDTQFPGLDIAGEYLKENSNPEDRIMFSGGQTFGVLWHADRKGFYPIPSADAIKKAEEKGVRWLFIYPPIGGNELNNPDAFNYIKENYELKQFGAIPTSGGFAPIYFVFKKGGTFDESKLSEMANEYPRLTRDYERRSGAKLVLTYVTFDNSTM